MCALSIFVFQSRHVILKVKKNWHILTEDISCDIIKTLTFLINNITINTMSIEQGIGLNQEVSTNEKVEKAIDEQIEMNNQESFTKELDSMIENLQHGGEEGIEDKVSQATAYLNKLQGMMAEAEKSNSRVSEGLIGLEMEKVKKTIIADIDKIIDEIKPIVEKEGPGNGISVTLRGTRLNMEMDKLEAMKKQFES